MSESQLPVTEQQIPADDRPGYRLAEARKAKGLSLEEVASQLRLNVSMLQALENDDYSHLPPAAYVSGYVRSYARALGLTEAELLRTRNSSPAGEPPIVGVVARSHTAQVQANDPRVRMVTYLVLGGLLLVSSAWWLVQREEPVPLPAEDTVAAETTVVPAVPAMPEAAAVTAAAPATPAPTGTVPVVIGVPANAVPARPAGAPTAPAAQTAAVAPTQAVVPTTTPPAPAKPETPPPPPLTADILQSKVVIELTADCWVDVVDAAGRQLAYELAPAGRKITLRGEAPFNVFFGYSPGVQVMFNDQAFDHRPYQRKDMARFKLGTAEDNSQSTEAQ